MPKLTFAWLAGIVFTAALTACGNITDSVDRDPDTTAYAGISVLQLALAEGELSKDQIVADSLARIQEHDRVGVMLNAVVDIAPSADLQAQINSASHGLLAGIPVLIKANIDTGPPMPTHAGSLALKDHVAQDNAQLVQALLRAGAVVVGKTNMSEWAGFRSAHAVAGWSSIGGQTKNPYVLDRSPCGSSSGSAVAVAAGYVPVAIGTETYGSIMCPAGVNGIVGMKPTWGMVSNDGVIPIAYSQDTAGPMARSVEDIARTLQVLAETRPLLGDPAPKGTQLDMLSALGEQKLDGLRVGVWRAYHGARQRPRVSGVLDDVLGKLNAAGVTTIDPIGLYLEQDIYQSDYQVLVHEFPLGLRQYLGGQPSLEALMAFNQEHAPTVMPWFGQDIFTLAQGQRLSDQDYKQARRRSQVEMRQRVDAVFAKFQLDVLIAPTNEPACPIDYVGGDCFVLSSAGVAAISGRPGITLPAAQIHKLPVGITLVGKAWQDAQLLATAYAVEQLLPQLPKPKYLPSLEP